MSDDNFYPFPVIDRHYDLVVPINHITPTDFPRLETQRLFKVVWPVPEDISKVPEVIDLTSLGIDGLKSPNGMIILTNGNNRIGYLASVCPQGPDQLVRIRAKDIESDNIVPDMIKTMANYGITDFRTWVTYLNRCWEEYREYEIDQCIQAHPFLTWFVKQSKHGLVERDFNPFLNV